MSKGIRLCDHLKQFVALPICCYELLDNLIDFRTIVVFEFPTKSICEYGLCHIAIEVCLVFHQPLLEFGFITEVGAVVIR